VHLEIMELEDFVIPYAKLDHKRAHKMPGVQLEITITFLLQNNGCVTFEFG
jgi:hypothetical protein